MQSNEDEKSHYPICMNELGLKGQFSFAEHVLLSHIFLYFRHSLELEDQSWPYTCRLSLPISAGPANHLMCMWAFQLSPAR